jgi:hypothetical protein
MHLRLSVYELLRLLSKLCKPQSLVHNKCLPSGHTLFCFNCPRTLVKPSGQNCACDMSESHPSILVKGESLTVCIFSNGGLTTLQTVTSCNMIHCHAAWKSPHHYKPWPAQLYSGMRIAVISYHKPWDFEA